MDNQQVRGPDDFVNAISKGDYENLVKLLQEDSVQSAVNDACVQGVYVDFAFSRTRHDASVLCSE